MSEKVLDNQENIYVPNSKRIKMSDGLGRPFFGERTVLGNLHTTSNLRIQPRRAAKQGVVYEKGFPKISHAKKQPLSTTKSRSSNFSIFNNSSNNSSAPFTIYNSSSATNTSSDFSVYTDSSSSNNSSIPTTSYKALLPPSAFTCSSSSTSNKEKSYLSNLTNVPTLLLPVVSRSTTLSDRIKQSLKVTVPAEFDFNSRCNKENDYFKPKLALPINFTVKSSNDKQQETLVKSSKKVCGTLSTVRKTDNRLREEIILDRKADSIWVDSIYANDIYMHLRRQEVKHRPKPNYIQKQAEITTSMRWILIDWLIEVASEYELYSQTLYLAVSYVDRFLSFMSVKRDKLQLVGTTAMFIAAKYEEIYPPEAKQFAYITDSTYKIQQIIKMEQLILRVLNFDISNPTALEFVDNFARMCNSDEKTVHLCQFITELSMLDCEPYLKYVPSMIAASALALANYNMELAIWPKELALKCHYELEDIKECYLHLNRSLSHVHEFKDHSIREKYKTNSLSGVADIIPRLGIPF